MYRRTGLNPPFRCLARRRNEPWQKKQKQKQKQKERERERERETGTETEKVGRVTETIGNLISGSPTPDSSQPFCLILLLLLSLFKGISNFGKTAI